jgi:hypothetical protein
LTEIVARAAGKTVSWQVAFTDPEVAESEACPALADAIVPSSFTTAMLGSELVHVMDFVTSCVDPSEKCPVAFNWAGVPRGIVRVAGLTSIDSTDGFKTVSWVDTVRAAAFALSHTTPTDREVTRPFESILAIPGSPLSHTTVLLTSSTVPSGRVLCAETWTVCPSATCGFGGRIDRFVN